jgi:molybdate transport system ATP-binding protein
VTSRLEAQLSARVGELAIEVELELSREVLVVCGPNGAGKTSLLSLLLGALPVERGRIDVSGTCLLDSASGVNVPIELRGLGYVPQDYALFPHLTVRQNVAFAARSAASRAASTERARRVDPMLDQLGLARLGDRLPRTLSGGERQRVALARALVIEPRALLLDEPLSALDVHARGEVRRWLGAHLRELGLPTLIVTHDPHDARELGDRNAVLEAGHITQIGTWQQLAAQPASAFVERLVS